MVTTQYGGVVQLRDPFASGFSRPLSSRAQPEAMGESVPVGISPTPTSLSLPRTTNTPHNDPPVLHQDPRPLTAEHA